MTFPTLGNGCGGLTSCYGFRGVVGSCIADNDGVNANMIAYVNAYDLTTVAWGILVSLIFNTPASTTPDSVVNASNPGPDALSQCFLVDNNGDPFENATVMRSQVWWPSQSQYGCLAVDSWNAYQTGLICCTGVTGSCGSNLLELPMANSSLPSPIVWNRCHYTAHLGLTASNLDAYYVSQLAFGVAANYGTNWNPSAVCYPSTAASPSDPFDGGIP